MESITKEQLHTIGRALYGTHWQTQMANAITNLNGDALDVRRVQQWACGARPVPDWILPELKKLGEKRLKELEELKKRFLVD